MSNDPKILVKKSDGTFVKVTMAEFLAMKKQKSIPPVQPVVVAKPQMSVVEPVKQIPAVASIINNASPHQAANKSERPAHPKSHIIHPRSEKSLHPVHHKPLTSADARSPLEEKIAIKSDTPLTSNKRESQVEEVVRRLGFGVAPDLLGRLKSLVLARLKDIKSNQEISDVLAKSVANGGLGLAQTQVEKIISTISEVHTKNNINTKSDQKSTPALKGKVGMTLMVEPPELPAIAVDVKPKPYNEIGSNVIARSEATKQSQPKPELIPHNDLVSKLVKESMANEPIFKISSKSTPKQFVPDISAPDTEMGPVEEIRSINLNDFRKLSSNSEEAAKRLQQKISNLQEESFIWYLDALSAYHNSPLYLEYIKSVCQSLAERKSLANVLMMKNSIKLSEAVAIIEMEKTL